MKHASRCPATAMMAVLLPALVPAALPAAPAAVKADAKGLEWNQWHGAKRDNISSETGLLKEWPSGGPTLAWKATGIGGGFSAVSFAGGKLFTMGDQGDACVIIALDAATGKKVWAAPVGKTGGGGGYPGPRATPATDGTLVWSIGQYGDLVCVQAATGKEVWRRNLEKDFGGKMMSGWGYSESPLLDGNLVVVTPGGSRGTVAALVKATGAVAWQTAELKDAAAYTSLVTAEIGGLKQYLLFTDASVAGIAAATGQVAWRAARPGKTAVVPDPVYAAGTLFVSSGYGVGCTAFTVAASGGRFSAQEAYANKDMEVHHGGLILLGSHVYGLTNRGELVCMELKTGKVAWRERSVGKGAITCVDGKLVVRAEGGAGAVALVDASPEGYKERGRFDQPDRSDKNSWAHPVVYGGRLYLRDQDVLLCYDVKGK